jgi:hypothetical protein
MQGGYEVGVPHELDIAVPVVDGVPLHEVMGKRFFGIDSGLVRPPSQHLLGEPSYAEQGLAVVLDGSCLIAGCCGVMVHIVVTDTTVHWVDFFTRGAPEITGSPAYEFDRVQYEAALHSIDDVPIENFPARDGA